MSLHPRSRHPRSRHPRPHLLPSPMPAPLQYTSQPFTAGDRIQLLTISGGKVIEGAARGLGRERACVSAGAPMLPWPRGLFLPRTRPPRALHANLVAGVVQGIEPSRTIIRTEDGSPVYIANADILNYLVK